MHSYANHHLLGRWALLSAAVLLSGCSSQGIQRKVPNLYEMRLTSGEKALSQGRYEEAIAEFSEALEYRTESGEAYYRRGLAQLQSGFPDTAIHDFDSSIRLQPGKAETYIDRARAYMMLRRPSNALRDCTRALCLHPGMAQAHYCRGKAYLETRNPERAVADFSEAIRLDASLTEEISPQLGIAYFDWAQTLHRRRQFDEADDAMKQAQSLNPQFVADHATESRFPVPSTAQNSGPHVTAKVVQVERLFQEGQECLEREDYDTAILKFTAVLNETPDRADAYQGRGRAFLRKGFPDTAVADFAQAILFDRSNPDNYCLRAEAYNALDNDTLAIRDCTEAIRRNPELGEAYRIRAAAYLSSGYIDRAQRDLGEAIRLGASNTDALQKQLSDYKPRSPV